MWLLYIFFCIVALVTMKSSYVCLNTAQKEYPYKKTELPSISWCLNLFGLENYVVSPQNSHLVYLGHIWILKDERLFLCYSDEPNENVCFCRCILLIFWSNSAVSKRVWEKQGCIFAVHILTISVKCDFSTFFSTDPEKLYFFLIVQ